MASAQDIAVQLQKLSNQATEKSFQYNTKEANTARTWQKMMSDTSHQREVADLQKAGLNPILSTQSGGAQSYTTSSASAQAENAANAVGNVWSSQIGADATRSAAAQSAAAMKSAAATQAAAARYAASLQYAASTYHSDKALEASKYKAKMDYKIAMNKPANNPWTLADKYATKFGVTGAITKAANNVAKKFNVSAFETPKSGTQITKNNFVLDKQGIALANRGLNKLGVTPNRSMQNLYVKAYVFGDQSSMSSLMRYTAQARRNRQNVMKRYTGSSAYTWKSSL